MKGSGKDMPVYRSCFCWNPKVGILVHNFMPISCTHFYCSQFPNFNFDWIWNLHSTFSILEWIFCRELVCLILSCQIWKPVHILTSKFWGINSGIGYKLVKLWFYTLKRCYMYTGQKNFVFSFDIFDVKIVEA